MENLTHVRPSSHREKGGLRGMHYTEKVNKRMSHHMLRCKKAQSIYGNQLPGKRHKGKGKKVAKQREESK